MKKTFIIIGMAVVICGCASVGRKLDESKVDQIKQGVTTRDQVIQLVGSPDQLTRDGAGNITFQYIYAHAQAKGSSFIPIYGAFAGGANVQNQFLTVTFTNNVVSSLVSTYGANEVNTGVNSGAKPAVDQVEANKRPN
jgi:outer membrane protein assembly factor BamE (lipoprotein component of BamABCDE complex)